MNIAILGAAGFIGTNLAVSLNKKHHLLLVDENIEYFNNSPAINENVRLQVTQFKKNTYFEEILKGMEIVYHLISTNNPTTSNKNIASELEDNVAITINILEACKKNHIKRIVFISSGGTIYGKGNCPIIEDAPTNPINTYGIQKLTIEKIIYLYNYLYGIDYRIVRLANPYGPYQRPDGKLGAVTTFTYKALKGQSIEIYGDGNNVRDYIYIEDAINAIINISMQDTKYKIYNVGSGKGLSLLNVIDAIKEQFDINVKVTFTPKRCVDLRENYLDCSRYIYEFGNITTIPFNEGLIRTGVYLKKLIDTQGVME